MLLDKSGSLVKEGGWPVLDAVQGRVLGWIQGENMRIALSVVGAVLVFFGGVWFRQGINVLPGSFISGQMRWAVRGWGHPHPTSKPFKGKPTPRPTIRLSVPF